MSKLNLLTYPLVAILSLAAAGVAFAESPTVDDTAATPSLKTREQVRAELVQARADGSIKAWSNSYNPLRLAKSEKTREEVRADRNTEYAALWYGEDSGSFALSRGLPVRQATPLYAGTPKNGQ